MTRLRRYEENVELIFKILYFLLAAGTFCPFIYDSSLQPILVKMVLGVGGILLFLRAADWKHYIRMPGLSWMALFVLSFLLSSFMNRRAVRLNEGLVGSYTFDEETIGTEIGRAHV